MKSSQLLNVPLFSRYSISKSHHPFKHANFHCYSSIHSRKSTTTPPTTTTPFPSIAIIGASPSGLTLSSLLHQNSIPSTVFDFRPSPTSLSLPSGPLDLHVESGLGALSACNLVPQFKTLSSECSQDLIVADKHGIIHHRDDGGPRDRPEILRNGLTSLLLSSIPRESVRWGSKLLSISRPFSSSKKWKLHLASSSSPLSQTSRSEKETWREEEEKEYDLILGCDGAWSRVRPALTSTNPYYSGINCITLTIPHISTRSPSLVSYIGKGSYSACGEGKAVIAQRGSQDSARVYLMLSSPSENYFTSTGISSLVRSPEGLKRKLLSEEGFYLTWAKPLQELIALACSCEAESILQGKGEAEISAKPFYMFPPSHRWESVPGTTLLGDAAHLTTPFAGEGVNAAMLGAVELAEGIVGFVKGGKELDGKGKWT